MDAVTEVIYSLNIEPITIISKLLDSTPIFGIILLAIVVLSEKTTNKKAKILLALMLAFIIGFGLKQIYPIDRPCNLENLKDAECNGTSFPSLHTIIAFILVSAHVRKKDYLRYLAFGLIVAFSRLYLGVHRFEEIAASAALAPLIYHTVDIWWKDE